MNSILQKLKKLFWLKRPIRSKPNSESKELTDHELSYIREKAECPYCGSKLLLGPCGGLSQNLFCENVDKTCGARFNIHGENAMYGGEYIC